MCGIVGAVAQRDVVPILIEGLRRLEYRGYDSAGVAVLNGTGTIKRLRAVGKVRMLQDALDADPDAAACSASRTPAGPRTACRASATRTRTSPGTASRWSTTASSRTTRSCASELKAAGYEFTSETDTEVIAHRVHYHLQKTGDLFKAVRATVAELEGAYALAVISQKDPERIVLARQGCPVVIGLGEGENFVASDVAALLPVTRRFMFLEEGDVAEIRRDSVRIVDQRRQHGPAQGARERALGRRGREGRLPALHAEGDPRAAARRRADARGTRRRRQAAGGRVRPGGAGRVRARPKPCASSRAAPATTPASVAKYFIEQICRLPCWVEIASEYRYRNPVVPKNTLFVSVSQSGETADTLAALQQAKQAGYLSQLAICNVPESSLVRESELVMLTRAGPEIGVASTKAFTTQLAALGMLVVALAKFHGADAERERGLVQRLLGIPSLIEATLKLDPVIKELAKRFVDKQHALFLGRGPMYPIAMEGALKLKEISYIHAEAYPAGELKHGPLALVDADMPVITIAPNNDLLEKLKSQPAGSARARRRAVRVRGSRVRHGVVGRRARDRDAAARELFPGAGGVHDSAAAAGVSLRDPQGHGCRSAAGTWRRG